MRSNPASASVIWVPIPTIWNTGATRNAKNAVNITKPPRVSAPAMICRAPMYITEAPTTPIRTVEERVSREMEVSVRMTFWSRRSTPPENTRASASSAWYPFTTRTPASDSVNRPVTSAVIFPRSRKMGRMRPNALISTRAKTEMDASAIPVSSGLVHSSTASENTATRMPPTNSTRPVPMRLRTPSTSFMMRDTSTPVLLAS